VSDPQVVRRIIAEVRPDAVIHLAAESHVTRSETAGDSFHRANVDGTRTLLEALLERPPAVVVHVSTDEVYGPCLGEPLREDQKEPGEGKATSPYARSKALADDVARSFTDRLPIIVARPTNCFGPWQHPEKALPRWVTRALRGLQLPVWGDGAYVRQWLPVEDACDALILLLEHGQHGGTYNIGPHRAPEVTNLDIARWIAHHVGLPDDTVLLTTYDRPDHDRRYAVDTSRMRALGWEPQSNLWTHLETTIAWYRDHQAWWLPLIKDAEAIYEDRAELQDVGR
jgi:dTDP-glucose 4,6-dehydratase